MNNSKSFYLSIWRWHFYAGLYVVPFMIMLSVTGLMMLYAPKLERWLHADLFYLPYDRHGSMSYEAQTRLVADHYPDATIKYLYVTQGPHDATRFQLSRPDEDFWVFVDPVAERILGDLSITHSLYAWADDTHGTFMLGLTGDWMIEIATSLTILLIVTGVFLWWPRGNKSLFQALRIRFGGNRSMWRDIHSVSGILLSVFLLFFCISGLSWTSVWGAKLVQAWSTFPMEKSAANVSSVLTHDELNRQGLKQIPWNLEQAPMPESLVMDGSSVSLDNLVVRSRSMGFSRFQLHFPVGDTGVYTATASSMGRDIENATDDRTIHFDRYNGAVLADIGYEDYNWFAKSMAIGIALHMGQMGWWNLLLCTFYCVGVLGLCITGVIMWWQRRPGKLLVLGAPPMPKDLRRWQHATWLLLPLSLLFPMAAATMITMLAIDFIASRWIPQVHTLYR
ncbi:PepSY-associated TM helix domain-containing protein [Gynuella sp.]|uniref:PepSY-associated TM helix domain-containing protein n=1 Tax=Gynuella sp. TaxID=2969146 RepID=UPI003D14A840